VNPLTDDNCDTCGTLTWCLTPDGSVRPILNAADDQGDVLILSPKGLGEKLAIKLANTTLEAARRNRLPLHREHSEHGQAG